MGARPEIPRAAPTRSRPAAWFWVIVLAAGLPCTAGAQNLALHRPYVWTRPPSYASCTDPGDSVQLTDGRRAANDFIWLDPATVGWQAEVGDVIGVRIDLGRTCRLDSLVFCTAVFPSAEVQAPSLLGAAGDTPDQLAWAGALEAGPETAGELARPRRVRLRMPLAARGRFVLVAALLRGRFCFSDEIEVYGQAVESGTTARAPSGTLATGPLGRAFASRDLAVAAAAQRRAWSLRTALPQQVENATAPPAGVPVDEEESLRLASRAGAWRARGSAALDVRRVDPWAPFGPWSDLQPAVGDTLQMWPGAWGAAAVDVASALATATEVQVSVRSPGTGAPHATLREVVAVEARDGRWFGDALPLAASALRVRPGEVRQLWIDVDAQGVAAGMYALQVVLGAATIEVPVRVHPVLLGAPLLHALDWAYPTTGGLTRTAPQAAVADNLAHDIDTAWIASEALPWPDPQTIDAAGHLTAPLDFSACDRELALYDVATSKVVGFFWNFDAGRPDPSRGRFRHAYNSPAWRQAVREWLGAWLAHLETRGLETRRVLMQPFDESSAPVVEGCFRSLHALRPDLRLALTITRLARPAELDPLLDDLAVAILERRTLETRTNWCREATARGIELWTYDVPQPAKAVAPFAGYRSLAWEAWARGFAGCAFWAYGDAGSSDVDTWNDFDAGHADFAVVYGPQGAPRALGEEFAPSKRWQAFRIGMQETGLFTAVAIRDPAWPRRVLQAATGGDGAARPERLRRTALEKLR